MLFHCTAHTETINGETLKVFSHWKDHPIEAETIQDAAEIVKKKYPGTVWFSTPPPEPYKPAPGQQGLI
jgi:hypothetical protein